MTSRELLHRSWIGSSGKVNWIMLNPSTADDVHDDPTIRKCIGFSKRWGYSSLVVTNLFSARSTHPSDLEELVSKNLAQAVGDSDAHIAEQARGASIVVAAWGNHGDIGGRADYVMRHVLPSVRLWCIGLTGKRHPLHPVRARYTKEPVLFRALNPHKAAQEWNEKYPVGTLVRYHAVIGEGEGVPYVTRSAASVLSGHTAVLWLEGKAGCVALEAVTVEDRHE